MRQRKPAAATSATGRRTAKGQPRTRPAVMCGTGLEDPVWGRMVTRELGTHCLECKKSERPGKRTYVKTRTIDGC